jgi:hypothetical protein
MTTTIRPIWCAFAGFPSAPASFRKLTEPGNLFDFEIMGAGALEEAPLGTYHERKFVVPVRLDLANLSNEVNYSTPT